VKLTGIIGIILIVLSAFALTYQGITYTSRKKVLHVGSIQATKKTRKTIPVPPALGGVILAGGVVLVVVGRKKGS
jgi:hypothetical protein